MKKFIFRLESVLHLRTLRLESERNRLAKQMAEAAKIDHALAALPGERAEAAAFIQKQSQTSLGASGAELAALDAFLKGYDQRAAELRAARERTQKEVAKQRQRVTEADRDERLLQKLKAKRLADWKHEEQRELETLGQEAWSALRHFRAHE